MYSEVLRFSLSMIAESRGTLGVGSGCVWKVLFSRYNIVSQYSKDEDECVVFSYIGLSASGRWDGIVASS